MARLCSLDVIAEEIYSVGVSGSVAELGVYQRNFAVKINEAFLDRTLYLFDTFEGFSKDDVKVEVSRGWLRRSCRG